MSSRVALALHVDADPDAETHTAPAGAYVVVLSTVLPTVGVELHSTYVGHGAAPTHATRLMLSPGVARTVTVQASPGALPVLAGRRSCLLDHAQQLTQLLAELEYPAGVNVTDEALWAVETGGARLGS